MSKELSMEEFATAMVSVNSVAYVEPVAERPRCPGSKEPPHFKPEK